MAGWAVQVGDAGLGVPLEAAHRAGILLAGAPDQVLAQHLRQSWGPLGEGPVGEGVQSRL